MALETYNPNDVARITGSDTQVDAGFTKANIQDTVCNFQIGDIFVIPKDFVVYKHDMGNGVFAEYTLIELHGELKQLYPSVFTKRRRVVEKDGSLTKIIASTKGTVAKEFMRHSTVQEAMEAIAGQQIKVSDANEVLCLKWKSTDQTYTSIYTFDFVETPAEEAPVEEVASVEELLKTQLMTLRTVLATKVSDTVLKQEDGTLIFVYANDYPRSFGWWQLKPIGNFLVIQKFISKR